MLHLKDLFQICSTDEFKALFSILSTPKKTQPILFCFLALLPSGIIILAILTLRSFLTKKSKNPNEKKISDNTVINTKDVVAQFPLATVHALCVVFTPLSGGWPSHLASYFQRSRVDTSVPQPLIELDLSELLSHLTSPSNNGGIELRDPNDLSDLFQGKLSVYGWSINLRINPSFWLLAGRWIASEQFCDSSHQMRPTDYYSPLSCAYDLDYAPYHNIEHLIFRLRRIHKPGSTFSIEFSCLSTRSTFFSRHFILCAIPLFFLSRLRNRNRTSQPLRSTTPLFLTLQQVIAILSKPSDFGRAESVVSIANVTMEHAKLLRAQERELVENRQIRSRIVDNKEGGVAAWREKRLAMLWEAGLLSAGLLTRWHIQLEAS